MNVDLLTMLKVDLGITAVAYDDRLYADLQAAKSYIELEGIKLKETIEDDQLVVQYAAWLWRKRGSDESSMPRMLRYLLNNRLFSEKMRMRGHDNG